MLRAVFLDRDGCINEDRDDYVKNVGELKVFPYAADSIRLLNEAGFEVFVVSNQQSLGKGLMTQQDLLGIQDEIMRQVLGSGGKISGFYYCPHLVQDGCSCRKPQPGLILRAAKEHQIDLSRSFMVGDTEKDIMAGKRAGCKTVLVLTGSIPRDDVANLPCQPNCVADDLSDAAGCILTLAAQGAGG